MEGKVKDPHGVVGSEYPRYWIRRNGPCQHSKSPARACLYSFCKLILGVCWIDMSLTYLVTLLSFKILLIFNTTHGSVFCGTSFRIAISCNRLSAAVVSFGLLTDGRTGTWERGWRGWVESRFGSDDNNPPCTINVCAEGMWSVSGRASKYSNSELDMSWAILKCSPKGFHSFGTFCHHAVLSTSFSWAIQASNSTPWFCATSQLRRIVSSHSVPPLLDQIQFNQARHSTTFWSWFPRTPVMLFVAIKDKTDIEPLWPPLAMISPTWIRTSSFGS